MSKQTTQRLTIAMVKEKLFGDDVSEEWLVEIRQDERAGVQKLLEQYDRKQLKEKELHDAFIQMSRYEEELYDKGLTLVAGVDEVGRGPIAGPVVASAVMLPQDFYLLGLNDSKQLSEKKRDEFFEIILEQAITYGIGIVGAAEIDLMNIHQASLEAMRRAVEQLMVPPEHLLVDAMKIPSVDYPQTAIVKGDAKSISIAASSVVAKVTRDRIMKDLAVEFPNYGFDKNMGYGTKEHLDALKSFGATPYHRLSFSPVKELIE